MMFEMRSWTMMFADDVHVHACVRACARACVNERQANGTVIMQEEVAKVDAFTISNTCAQPYKVMASAEEK